MQLAVSAARRAEGRTGPNPPVGCAITDQSGRLVAVGHTARGGRPHAETEALAMAGDAARGGCAYVTLEPCSHVGKTGACADALIAAGVARVVIAVQDPDSRVDGQGIDRLRAAGIRVDCGAEADAANRAMAGFLYRMRHARPLVTLKTATSMDGRIALADGKKRWITGPDMRRYVHLQRSRCDAIMTAIGTVIADDPELTCRLHGLVEDNPHRYVLDSHLRLPTDSALLKDVSQAGLTVFCRHDASADHMTALRNAGAIVQTVDTDDHGRLSLPAVMAAVAAAEHSHLMVESGGKLAASLLHAGLVDRISWTQSPHIIGEDGVPSMAALNMTSLPETPAFKVTDQGQFGADRFILMERAAE